MNFGPLEFGALLRRQESRGDGATEDRAPVSVYEAIIDRAPAAGQPVRVRVQPAWRPVVLVLSAHQPVHWRIEAAPGADLRAILLAGGAGSRVTGAAQIPVRSIGGFFCFKRGSMEFRHLEREVRRCTGRAIGNFHCSYAEEVFEVGLD